MYKALYREYRPEVFSEVLGQEHIVKILKNQIAKAEVGHAYLFCGTRGTGKTTIARILAKGINCITAPDTTGEIPCGKCESCLSIKNGTFMDVIEIDAASNNGVDSIRELRESVKYPPAIGKKKVYIIDEVHMLSTGAFNALLKTLEEPPEHVVFILATTDPQKLPATILSRCMRLDFRRVSENVLLDGMTAICKDKGVEISQDALRIVVRHADGSVRDGLSILEQCLATGDTVIEKQNVLEFLGTAGEETFIELTDYVNQSDTPNALLLLERVMADGKDVRQFLRDWITHFRNLLILKFMDAGEDALNHSAENLSRLKMQAETTELVDINNAILELSKVANEAKLSNQPRILLELCIVRLATGLTMQAYQEGTRKPSASKKVLLSTGKPKANTPIAQESAPVQEKRQPDAESEVSAHTQEKSLQEDKRSINAANTASVSSEQTVNNVEITSEHELQKIWHMIFEEGEQGKSSYNILRTGTKLVAITKDEFIVEAESGFKEIFLENNKRDIESIFEKVTGTKKRLKRIAPGEEHKFEKQVDANQVASELETLLGVSIKIE